MIRVAGDAKDDGEGDLYQYEGELVPERDPDDAVVAIMDAEALVLGAYEDGLDDEAADEEDQEAVVQIRVMVGIEDGEQDEPRRASDGE